MLDPFTFFSRMVSVAIDMTSTAMRVSETLIDSHEVIARRLLVIRAASRSPMNGDYAELSRIVPEKIDAFSKAGAVMASGWWAMQLAAMSQAQKLGTMAMRGRLPMPADWSAGVRSTAFGLNALEKATSTAARALRPIHVRTKANAKRLKGRKV